MATSLRGNTNTKRRAGATGEDKSQNPAVSTATATIISGSDSEAYSSKQPRKRQRRGTDEEEHIDREIVAESTKREPGTSNGDNQDQSNKEDNGDFPDVAHNAVWQDEQGGDDDRAGPHPPIPAATVPATSNVAAAPANALATVDQRFTALCQIYPNVPDPGQDLAKFQAFAQVTEGKRTYATHSPKDDVGTRKIINGNLIPDCALVCSTTTFSRASLTRSANKDSCWPGEGEQGLLMYPIMRFLSV
ncbi:hypothetical protein PMIN04_007877 [Paraphaeosphaeria minitans]